MALSVILGLPLWWYFHENGLSNDSGMSPVQPLATKQPLKTRVSPELQTWLKRKIYQRPECVLPLPPTLLQHLHPVLPVSSHA